MCSQPTVVLFGSVKSSDIVLRVLAEEGLRPAKVYSLQPKPGQEISGYYPIHETARELGLPWEMFTKINAPEIIRELEELAPDYLFVVGLSQLIGPEILHAAKQGVIGLHPAPLPKYRGRASLVWQMLRGETQSAVSLFFIDEGMDTGDLIVQEPFPIEPQDYIYDADQRMLQALERGMVRVARMLRSGTVARIHQDHTKATYGLKRTPEDGEISWELPAQQIQLLIRAVSRPYPGAFSLYDGTCKVIFWRAEVLENHQYIGNNGQICAVGENSIDVLCRDGILRVTEYELCGEVKTASGKLLVGHKFR